MDLYCQFVLMRIHRLPHQYLHHWIPFSSKAFGLNLRETILTDTL